MIIDMRDVDNDKYNEIYDFVSRKILTESVLNIVKFTISEHSPISELEDPTHKQLVEN